MEKLKANEIKVGILTEIKKNVIKTSKDISFYAEFHSGSRGILFTETREKKGKDILYPIYEYPILDSDTLLTPYDEFDVDNDTTVKFIEWPAQLHTSVVGVTTDKYSLNKPTIGITKYEELNPLFQYYGLTEFSSEDLKKFLDEILLNKKWLKEHYKLFGYNAKKFGFFQIAYSTLKMQEEAVLPENLGKIISEVHDHNGLRLLKKERKMYELR